MFSSEALKAVYADALPVFRRYMSTLRELNVMFMSAWRNGTLDQEWAEFQASNPGYYLVYFVRARGMGDIKIGKSNHVGTRVKSLWTGASRALDLVACYPSDITHEIELHREFEHLRLCGEWFRPGDELLTHLELVGCDIRAFSNAVPAHFYRRFPERLLMNDVSATHKMNSEG
jgi:hypothetical protein